MALAAALQSPSTLVLASDSASDLASDSGSDLASDTGSDLASVRTRARKVPGGWLITGRKIWTTDADLRVTALPSGAVFRLRLPEAPAAATYLARLSAYDR